MGEAMKRKAQMNKMLQLRQNKDCEVARVAHSIAKQTGIHTWTLIWSHVPTRNNGSYDCVGVCAEEYENYGPAAPPLLGAVSKFEKTKSIGLYANGMLLLNGVKKQIETNELTKLMVLKQRKEEYNQKYNKNKKNHKKDTSNTTIPSNDSIKEAKQEDEQKVDTQKETKETKQTNEKEKPMILFTKGQHITVTINTDVDNGVLTFAVDGEILTDATVNNLFTTLGTTTIHPCIGMCPYDPTADDNQAIQNKTQNDATTTLNTMESKNESKKEGVLDQQNKMRIQCDTLSKLMHTDPATFENMSESNRLKMIEDLINKKKLLTTHSVTLYVEKNLEEEAAKLQQKKDEEEKQLKELE